MSDAAAPEVKKQRSQQMLFGDPLPDLDEDTGYRGPIACKAAGITYRQLDYWDRTGLVSPSIRTAAGSGSQRLYSFRDILVLKVVKRLLDTGVSLQQIRVAVAQLVVFGYKILLVLCPALGRKLLRFEEVAQLSCLVDLGKSSLAEKATLDLAGWQLLVAMDIDGADLQFLEIGRAHV